MIIARLLIGMDERRQSIKKKKYFFIILFILSISIGMVISHFEWEDGWNSYNIPFVIAICVGSMLVNMIYNLRYSRKMNALLSLLEDGAYKDFIVEMERIRCCVKSKHLEALCVLNMATAYDNMGEFEQALELLLTISDKKLVGNNHNVYHLNLATCYFHTERCEEGVVHYQTHEQEISGLKAYPYYQPYVEVLKLYVMLEMREFKEAREQLEFVKESFELEAIPEDLDYFEECLVEEE